jgi:beta-glucosidase-like glycosyl hydrolase
MGEDPLVIGRLGAALIAGLQQGADGGGHGKALKIAAVGKHLAAYGLECFGPNTYPTCGYSRKSFDSVVSPGDLNTSYLPQWRAAVGAGLSGAMCSCE